MIKSQFGKELPMVTVTSPQEGRQIVFTKCFLRIQNIRPQPKSTNLGVIFGILAIEKRSLHNVIGKELLYSWC